MSEPKGPAPSWTEERSDEGRRRLKGARRRASEGMLMSLRLADRVAVITGAGSGIGLASARGSRPRAPRWWRSTSTRRPARRPRPRSAASSCGRRGQRGRRPAAVRDGGGPARAGGHRVQQRGHLAAGGRLDPDHRAGGLAPGPAGQPDLGLPVLQGRDPAHAAAGQGVDRQHRLVRGRAGLGHLADLLHRVQGRGAGAVAASSACSSRGRGSGSTRCARAR